MFFISPSLLCFVSCLSRHSSLSRLFNSPLIILLCCWLQILLPDCKDLIARFSWHDGRLSNLFHPWCCPRCHDINDFTNISFCPARIAVPLGLSLHSFLSFLKDVQEALKPFHWDRVRQTILQWSKGWVIVPSTLDISSQCFGSEWLTPDLFQRSSFKLYRRRYLYFVSGYITAIYTLADVMM